MRCSRLIAPKLLNPGDRLPTIPEESLPSLNFTVHQITGRKRADDPRRHLIFPCFSEFGSEVIGSMFCIPKIEQTFPGHYKTVIGWHGREYLYRHLADEFWELNEDQMWLKEYSRAFHHESSNLKKFEESLKGKGVVVTSNTFGRIALTTQCNKCWRYWPEKVRTDLCAFCGSKDLKPSLYSNINGYKDDIVLPPKPSGAKMEYAKSLVKSHPVGIFARARKCYGRNLPPEFYVKLINKLEVMGYDPIWLGEKASTLPCPMDHIIDFSRMEESRDMETTAAIVSFCDFTVQFWTASTRLAAMTKVPFLLFESPDQLWDHGQEGYRLDLVTIGKRKIVANHYLNVLNEPEVAIDLVERCVREMRVGNYEDVIGMVDNPAVVARQRKEYHQKQINNIRYDK